MSLHTAQRRRVVISGKEMTLVMEIECTAFRAIRPRSVSEQSFYSIECEIDKVQETPSVHKSQRKALKEGTSYCQRTVSTCHNNEDHYSFEKQEETIMPGQDSDFRSGSYEMEAVIQDQPQSVTASAADSQSTQAAYDESYDEAIVRQAHPKTKTAKEKSIWVPVLCWCPLMCPAGCDCEVPCGPCCPNRAREITVEDDPDREIV